MGIRSSRNDLITHGPLIEAVGTCGRISRKRCLGSERLCFITTSLVSNPFLGRTVFSCISDLRRTNGGHVTPTLGKLQE